MSYFPGKFWLTQYILPPQKSTLLRLLRYGIRPSHVNTKNKREKRRKQLFETAQGECLSMLSVCVLWSFCEQNINVDPRKLVFYSLTLIGEFPSGNCYCKWVSIVAIRLLLNKGGFNIFRHLWHNVCTAYLDTWLHFVKLESLFTRISLGDSSWGVTTTTPVLMLMLIFVPNSSLSTRDLKRDDVNTRNSYWSFVILVRFLIITC